MTSPFPGMDPFIEGCGLWGDFHSNLISEIHRAIADVVPDRYFVRTAERSYLTLVDLPENKHHRFYPDVKVTERTNGPKNGRKQSKRSNGGVAVVDEPVEMGLAIEDEQREKFVEIYESQADQRLVTSIEVLSPTNKREGTNGWNEYLRKRRSVLISPASLVEIDLLRGGERMPMSDKWPKGPYMLLVNRQTSSTASVWPAHFKKRLPLVPVPLAHPDPDVLLDLQPMVEAIYKRSRYEYSIDYANPINPPLTKTDRDWLKRQLKKQKK